MPSVLVIKHSNTASSAPTVGDIIEGELAVNTIDKKIYTRDDANNIVELSNGNIDANHTHVAADITDFTTEVNTIISTSSFTRPAVTTQAGTSYTIDADDEHSMVMFTNAGAIAVTIGTQAAGYIVHLHQKGAGQITVAGSGVTLNAAIGLKTRAQYSALTVMFDTTTTASIIGDATA